MKKLLMALAITLGVGYSAEAQKTCTCPATVKKTAAHKCSVTKAHKSTTGQYAQNFKVCKDPYGYKICGERRTAYNSTTKSYPGIAPASDVRNYNSYTQVEDRNYAASIASEDYPTPGVLMAPQSQSYPAANINLSTANSYQGYYPKRSKIIVSYDNGTAPYEAQPSPQYDGPEKNKNRNLKVNSPEQVSGDPSISLPPPSGEIKK
jgi:hypothetical protein